LARPYLLADDDLVLMFASADLG